jgi:quinolinate synthase
MNWEVEFIKNFAPLFSNKNFHPWCMSMCYCINMKMKLLKCIKDGFYLLTTLCSVKINAEFLC